MRNALFGPKPTFFLIKFNIFDEKSILFQWAVLSWSLGSLGAVLGWSWADEGSMKGRWRVDEGIDEGSMKGRWRDQWRVDEGSMKDRWRIDEGINEGSMKDRCRDQWRIDEGSMNQIEKTNKERQQKNPKKQPYIKHYATPDRPPPAAAMLRKYRKIIRIDRIL